ncbi:MAG: hypothetical protein RJB62_1569 [Pseudomonadota bacterium]|jgi:hypothetical protein
MATPYWDEPKRTPLGKFETGPLLFLGALFVAAGAFWYAMGVEEGATSYQALVAHADDDTMRCGLEHFTILGRDSEDRLIHIDATATGELIEGRPFARFSVKAEAMVPPASRETVPVAEAALRAGAYSTQETMVPMRTEDDAFVATKHGPDEALTLALDMLGGTVLLLRLTGDTETRNVVFPPVADNRVARRVINCFTDLRMRMDEGA